MASSENPLLRLVALDADDIAVMSANLQDAVVRAADMAYLPKEKRFALLMSRFDWAVAATGRMERSQCGVHFDRVSRASFMGFVPGDAAAVLNLLTIGFEADEAPGGAIELTFSGGAAIRLEVECVDGQLRDTGPRWETRARPGHAIVEDESGAS